MIFGQDPYPRETSATGIAFYDGEVTSWQNKLAPSLKNILKSALMSSGMATPADTIATLRKTVVRNKLLEPPQWFEYTIANGVLWLNTALTFSGKEKAALDRHTKFWAPIIEEIIRVILVSKHESDDQYKGIVFAFWGGNAQKLAKTVNRCSSSAPSVKVESCFASHPCTNTFCTTTESMADINEKLRSIGQKQINWCPRN